MTSVVLGYFYQGQNVQFVKRLALTLIFDAVTILNTLQNILS